MMAERMAALRGLCFGLTIESLSFVVSIFEGRSYITLPLASLMVSTGRETVIESLRRCAWTNRGMMMTTVKTRMTLNMQ
jgi:hypothetical protein